MSDEQEKQRSAADQLLQLLKTQQARFFERGGKFRYWIRGGDPEGYTSKLLEIEFESQAGTTQPAESSITASFTRTKFDLSYDPPYLAEKFSLPLKPQAAAEVIQSLLTSEIFRKKFDAEKQSQHADSLKLDWQITRGEVELKKTFFELFPKISDDLDAATKKLIEKLQLEATPKALNPKRR